MNKIKDSYTKVLSHIQEGDYLKTEPDLHKITNLVEEMAQSEKHRGLDSIRDQQKVILMRLESLKDELQVGREEVNLDAHNDDLSAIANTMGKRCLIKIENEVTFDDIIGLESVKKDIKMELVNRLKYPTVFPRKEERLNMVLFYGVPGTSKTDCFYAAVKEAKVSKVYFLHPKLVNSTWKGQSVKNLLAFFMMLRSNRPCFGFMDECEYLLKDRSDSSNNSNADLTSAMLMETDSNRKDNYGITLVCATNKPSDIDSGFRRRFRDLFYFPPPNIEVLHKNYNMPIYLLAMQ